MTEVRPVHDEEIAPVIAIWERAGMTRPWNPPERERAFREKPDAY